VELIQLRKLGIIRYKATAINTNPQLTHNH